MRLVKACTLNRYSLELLPCTVYVQAPPQPARWDYEREPRRERRGEYEREPAATPRGPWRAWWRVFRGRLAHARPSAWGIRIRILRVSLNMRIR